MQTEKDRILELRKALEYHNYKYYIENAPEISDREFDGLMHDLEKLEEKYPEMYDPNSPTQRVGRDINQEFTQVAHKYPMLSLGNTYSEEELRDFDQRVRKVVGDRVQYVCELKYDGTSISLTYVNGELTQAVTRGDGVKGDDVTANVDSHCTLEVERGLSARIRDPGGDSDAFFGIQSLEPGKSRGRRTFVRQSPECCCWNLEITEFFAGSETAFGLFSLLYSRRSDSGGNPLRKLDES
mgnify:CR=1 FL=1